MLEPLFLPAGRRWDLVGVRVEPLDPDDPAPLTTTDLRRIAPTQLAAAFARKVGPPPRTSQRVDLRSLGGDGPDRKRAGRRPYWNAARLTEVARIYTAAYDRGDHPTQAVARRKRISRPLAAKLVARCRLVGLLPKTRPGRARGGQWLEAAGTMTTKGGAEIR